MRDRDIKQRSDKDNSIEEDFHSQQYTSFCNYDNIAAAGYL
jgi:hypothetical protein